MSRKALLGYLQDSAATEIVTVGGATYEVRGLTLAQVRDLTRRARKGDEIEVDRYQALTLIASVYDEKGERVFDDADLDVILAAPAGRLAALITATNKVNGADDAPLDENADGSSN